jgi:PAS domain S-box-containing protein
MLEGRGEVRQDARGEVLELYGTGHDITELHESRSAIEESERSFRILFQSSPDAIAVFRADGTMRDANPAAALLFQSDLTWLLGRTYVELCPPEDREAAHEEFDALLTGEFSETTRPLISKEGKRFPTEMRSNNITLDEERAVLIYMRDISERLETEETLRRLGRRQESVLERERQRISREVHDVLGQALTALRMDVSWTRSHLDDERVPERLDQMGERINETIETVRRIAHDLRPGILDDFGLSAAIDWYAGSFSTRTGVKARIGALDNPELSGELTTTIFRVYQELCTNVARHAQASEVDVSLTAPGENLILSVKDNGRGMDLERVKQKDSLGLLGIRERLSPWGGRLEIESRPGQGTRAEVIVPIKNHQRKRQS